MKKILALAIPLLFLGGCVLSVQPAQATFEGAYHTGYTYSNGYWYRNGIAYTRKKVYEPVTYTYYNGCYSPVQYFSYVYTAYVAPAPNYNITPPAYSADWKTEATRFLAKREDLNAYLKFIDSVGYRVAPGALLGAANYSGSYGYGYGNGSYGTYGVTANTQYGLAVYPNQYTVNSSAAAYGETDAVTIVGINRTMQTAVEGGLKIVAGQQELAGINAEGRARILEFQARQNLVRELGKAANIAPSVKTTTTTTGTGAATVPPPTPAGEGTPPIMPRTDDNGGGFNVNAWLQLPGPASCVKCHTGDAVKKNGGFDISTYPQMTDELRDRVTEKLNSKSPEARMPKGLPELTEAQKRAFYKVPSVNK